ncbi:hypothetical protein LINGRAPRIM_LOCUS2663 [Linum grandiflorum]
MWNFRNCWWWTWSNWKCWWWCNCSRRDQSRIPLFPCLAGKVLVGSPLLAFEAITPFVGVESC